MSPLTLFLAKLFGVSCLLMCGALLIRPKSSIATITGMMDNPGLLLVIGIMTTIAGAALVIGHDVLSDEPLTLVVTVLGWATLIKGAALMTLPPKTLGAVYRGLHYPQRFALVMAAGLAFSVWLTAAAFLAG